MAATQPKTSVTRMRCVSPATPSPVPDAAGSKVAKDSTSSARAGGAKAQAADRLADRRVGCDEGAKDCETRAHKAKDEPGKCKQNHPCPGD